MRKKLNSFVLAILVVAMMACDGTGTIVGPHFDGVADAGTALPSCGNAICEVGEACLVCPQDCSQCDQCPNSICDEIEDCTTCPDDCGTCPSVCGNDNCETGEDCESCPEDCTECTTCPDGVCDSFEDCMTCAADCGLCLPVCGNSDCEGGEDCDNCPGDCGACPPTCGNSVCEGGEDCGNCPGDCGACPPTCGNSLCEGGEDCGNCPGDCGACPPVCGNSACEAGETCSNCTADCGACPVTHETEFITWNLYNDAGCTSSNGVAKWYDRNNGPGPLSIQDVLLTQAPAILALQEDGKLGPASCELGNIKDKVAGWLSGTHDVRSTDDVSGSWSGERYGIFIRESKYSFISAGYQKCYYGSEVRGFMWAEVDLIADSTSNHFYVLNAHFKAGTTSADIAQRTAQAQCVIDWVNAKKLTNPHRAHFLLGDLNSGPDHNNDAYALLTGAGGPFENTSTAGTDGINTHGTNWIDHVLATKNDFTKAGYGSWTVGAGQVENGGLLSDHVGLRTRIGHLR